MSSVYHEKILKTNTHLNTNQISITVMTINTATPTRLPTMASAADAVSEMTVGCSKTIEHETEIIKWKLGQPIHIVSHDNHHGDLLNITW